MDKRELKWEHMLAGIDAQSGYLRSGAARALHMRYLHLPIPDGDAPTLERCRQGD